MSVKGVYFQAEVMGEAITWLVPHPFTQTVPREVTLCFSVKFVLDVLHLNTSSSEGFLSCGWSES